MAVLNNRDINAYLAKPDFAHAIYLIYGPDQGLVNERANQLAEKSGIDLSDPFSLLKLTADDAAGDPGRISDEANTIGMFGGRRLIRIAGRTQRDLMKALKPVLESPPVDSFIIVEAGDLKKSVALRRGLENHRNSLCIPCYQDTAAALEMLIDQEIVAAGLAIDRDTRQELRSMLGENRQLSRNELRKLALYCEGRDTVQIDDIRAIVGDGANLVINDLIDAVSTGDPGIIQPMLPKVIAAGTNPDMVLAATLRQFQLLQVLKSGIEGNRQSVANALSAVRPPIHFSRKEAISTALHIWPTQRISRVMKRIDQMMLECRRNSAAAASIAGTTLLAIALEARALRTAR